MALFQNVGRTLTVGVLHNAPGSFHWNSRLILGFSLINPREVKHLTIYSKKSMESRTGNKETVNANLGAEEFRVLDLKKTTVRQKRQRPVRTKFEVPPPRTTKMKEDQDWSSVWPTAKTFHPALVPLPIRQGRNKMKAPPGKFANAELMKIPNFLHLTPPAIEKHCEALKKFCTPWPSGLETDEKCSEIFPIEVITSDYCHSSPVIRDPLSRIVTIKFKLKTLPLDKHATDKILRLLGDRYDEKTDVVTITTDRCPLRQQNYDYSMYLLTALFHESWRYESWEKEKSLDDMECYEWKVNRSYENVINLLSQYHPELDVKNLSDELQRNVEEYKEAIENLFNNSRDEDTVKLDRYKEASVKLLF